MFDIGAVSLPRCCSRTFVGAEDPFAEILDAVDILCAATVTRVAVAAPLSALNANLCGISRMAYSLAGRGEAPRLLALVSKPRVLVVQSWQRLLRRCRGRAAWSTETKALD